MGSFFQTLLDGLALGSMYALVALGYTMVYGVLKFINFAHGDVVMVGAFFGLLGHRIATTLLGFEPTSTGTVLLVFLFSMVLCGALGFTIERLAYRPLRKAPRLTALITAIGISLLLENLAQLDLSGVPSQWFRTWWPFSPNPKPFPSFIEQQVLFDIGGVRLLLLDAITIGLSGALMVVLYLIVFKTKLGRAIRAVSHNQDVAALMGIPIDRVISLTFVLGSVLAAFAGVQYGLRYGKIQWILGISLGLKAFVAAVFGGIGNIPGAMLGGVILGLSESLVATYGSSNYRDALAFALLIFVLLFRPSGLLGKFEPEKV